MEDFHTLSVPQFPAAVSFFLYVKTFVKLPLASASGLFRSEVTLNLLASAP